MPARINARDAAERAQRNLLLRGKALQFPSGVLESPDAFLLPRMNSRNSSAFAAALVASATMGTLGYFVREAAPVAAPVCSFARFAIGLLLLLPLMLYRSRGGARVWAFSPQAALSGLGIGICILFYFLAMRRTTLALAILLVYTGPIMAAVGECLLLRRRPPLRDALPLGVSLLGLGLVCFGGDAAHAADPIGVLESLTAGFGYAIYLLCNSHMPADVGLMRRTFWQFTAGCLFAAVPLFFIPSPLTGCAERWFDLLAIGCCHGFAVMILIVYAARRLSSIQYGTIAFMEPIVAVGLGFLVYQELMQPLQWLGFALVVAAALAQSLLPRAEA